MRTATRRRHALATAALVVLTSGVALPAWPASAAPAPGPGTPSGGIGHLGRAARPAPTGPADDRLLVTLAPGTSDATVEHIAASAHASVESRAGTTVVLDPAPGRVTAGATVAAQPGVRAVEPNGTLVAAQTPNDPYFGVQWGLADTQPGGIRAPSAWNNATGTRDVVVGVLDTGIDLTHPDLVANLWTNRTGINGCGYGTHGFNAVSDDCAPVDDDSHGTHVAGIVGATGNNGVGVTGVAQVASLMALRMLHYDPVSGGATGSEADAIQAIDWALAAEAQGVNLRVLQASWSAPVFSQALSDAIGRAQAAGVLFVVAAGNGANNSGPGLNLDLGANGAYPCEDTHSNVVCVAATDQTDHLTSFSNFGATSVDLAAPGYQIASTVPTGMLAGCYQYCAFDGTSMAAPFVSGAAVDVLAAEPNLTLSQLRARLLGSVDPVPALSGLVATGGRLDVCKATPVCGGLPAVPPTKVQNLRATVGDGQVQLQWASPDSSGNGSGVSGFDVNGPAGTTSGLSAATRSFTLTGLPDNVTSTVQVRAVGSGGNGPWVAVQVRPYVGGLEVDALGVIHTVAVGGRAPSVPLDGPAWSTDVARGLAILPTGTGGYVVDLFGGLHPFRIGADSPLPPAATGGPYWLGWGIARGVALSSQGGGYVLDGFGGVHPFGIGAADPAPPVVEAPYWLGWDIARGVTFAPNGTSGYVVDGYGGLHAFRSSGALPPPPTGGPYWLGWDIVRGVTLVTGSGGGWVLDGYGGVHGFGSSGAAPPRPTDGPYWLGWDIARGIGA